MACTLATKEQVEQLILNIFAAGTGRTDLTPETELSEFGWGSATQFTYYNSILASVHARGCKLHFGPGALVDCETIGDIIDLVWNDVAEQL
jgi:hypothetical protein